MKKNENGKHASHMLAAPDTSHSIRILIVIHFTFRTLLACSLQELPNTQLSAGTL